MIKVRLASLALAAFALSTIGSVAMADCGCAGKQGLLAKLKAKKDSGCNGGGLLAKLKAKKAAKSCCEPAPAPTCGCEAPAPAPTCGCAAPAPAPTCGCAAPAPAPSCGCGVSVPVSAPVSTGCSSCGTTLDAGSINTSTVVPPAPAAAPAAAPASVSDKAPAA